MPHHPPRKAARSGSRSGFRRGRCWPPGARFAARAATVALGLVVFAGTSATSTAAQTSPGPGTAPEPVPSGPTGLLTAGGSALGGIARDLVAGTAARALGAVVDLFVRAATWLLRGMAAQLNGFLTGVGGTDLTASWWTAQYNRVLPIAMLVAAAMLLLALVGAAARGSLEHLVQALLVDVPVAAVVGGVGPILVQYLVDVCDQLSAAFATTIGGDVTGALPALADWLVAASGNQTNGTPLLVVVLLAIGALLAALLTMLELLLRANAIYLLAALIPVAYALRIWPAIRPMARRLTEVLVVIVAAKPVIVFTLALGTARLTSLDRLPSAGSVPIVTPPALSSAGDATGAVLLLLAGLAPWALLALLPALESGVAAAWRERNAVGAGPRSGLQAATSTAYFAQLARGGLGRRGAAGPAAARAGAGAAAGPAAATATAATAGARTAARTAQTPMARQQRQATTANPPARPSTSTRRPDPPASPRPPTDPRQRRP